MKRLLLSLSALALGLAACGPSSQHAPPKTETRAPDFCCTAADCCGVRYFDEDGGVHVQPCDPRNQASIRLQLESLRARLLPTPPADSTAATDGGQAPRTWGVNGGVNGRLPPERIQRIVRGSFGPMRDCYERGLGRNGDLRGKVTTKFVIGISGDVTMTADGGSDMPDKEVLACVVRVFGTLKFPPPEGGMVTVVYPIQFAPALEPDPAWPEAALKDAGGG